MARTSRRTFLVGSTLLPVAAAVANHVAEDDARCVSAASVASTAAAFQSLIERLI